LCQFGHRLRRFPWGVPLYFLDTTFAAMFPSISENCVRGVTPEDQSRSPRPKSFRIRIARCECTATADFPKRRWAQQGLVDAPHMRVL
jgi:hypothetical protein